MEPAGSNVVMFEGPIAFPITPFKSDGGVNYSGVRTNAEMLATSGIASIVAPSGTGELFSLTPDECARITRETVKAVNGRKPVVAAVGFGPAIAVALAREAEAAGANAILVLPPYYQNPDPDGLLEYYLAVARATRLPFVPYARDAAEFTPELVEQLANAAPTFAAFKDGRGNIRAFIRIREHVIEKCGAKRLTWLAGVGDDLLAPYVAAGAQGFTSSMACFWPEIAVELWDARHDLSRLNEIHLRAIRPVYELRARRRGYEVSIMKAACELLGYPAGDPRPPLVAISREERESLRILLSQLGAPRRQEITT